MALAFAALLAKETVKSKLLFCMILQIVANKFVLLVFVALFVLPFLDNQVLRDSVFNIALCATAARLFVALK